ncbi:MAG: phage portal protein family protein [Desulfuromonadaceae bacterium]
MPPTSTDPTNPPKGTMLSMEIGSSGLQWYRPGIIQEEFLPELSGKAAIEVYTQMGSNDPTVAALLFVVEMIFRSVSWYVQKAGDEPQDIEAADFLDSCMGDMQNSWSSFIGEVSSEFQFGHAPFEIVYKRRAGETDDYTTGSKYDDGLIGWNKISIRSQNTILYWHFDDQGVLRGLWQLAPPLYRIVFIPIEKILLFRTKSSKGNPEGKSILRSCYRPYFIKKSLEDIRNIGLERGLAGIPRFWLPPEIASPVAGDTIAIQAKQAWIKTGKSIRQDAQSCIIMPLAYDDKGNKQYDMDLVTTPGAGAAEITATIKEKAVEILQSALAEFIMLGVSAGGVGSYALSQDKTAMFLKALETYLAGVEDTLNRHAVPRLFKLNPKFAVKKYPETKHKPLRDVNMATVAQMLSTMKNTGAKIFPDLDLENFLREAMGLPVKSEEQAEAEKAQAEAPTAAKPGLPGMLGAQGGATVAPAGPEIAAPEEGAAAEGKSLKAI